MNRFIISGIGVRLEEGKPTNLKNLVPETFITHVHLFTIDDFKIRHEMFIEDGILDWMG